METDLFGKPIVSVNGFRIRITKTGKGRALEHFCGNDGHGQFGRMYLPLKRCTAPALLRKVCRFIEQHRLPADPPPMEMFLALLEDPLERALVEKSLFKMVVSTLLGKPF